MALVAMAMLSGCSSTDWIKDRISSGASNETEVLGAPDADAYVQELGLIAAGDATAQAEAYEDAAATARLTPGTTADLRLGLVLAVPGHPHSDASRAVTLLRGVLNETELLTQAEIALARIMLNSAERQAMISSENMRIQSESSRVLSSTERQAAARQAALEAENQRLRAELADAQQKLEALTSIERDIRER
ncbi:MAG: hypothetical protein AAFN50_05180 [Pseudomonadota bacterium]